MRSVAAHQRGRTEETMIPDTLMMDITLLLGTAVAIIAVQWAVLPMRKHRQL